MGERMSEDGSDAGLAALLREAGRAHHEAFASVGGADPAWARWYAEFLVPRLAILGASSVDATEVAGALADAEQSRKQDSPDADWPTYYASWMLARRPWRVRTP
jgi:hypothetical protein